MSSLNINAKLSFAVDSIAALRALPYALLSTNPTPTVQVKSYYAGGNGAGGGPFVWGATSNAVDDGGFVINPTGNSGAGRFLRLVQHGFVTPQMGGAACDGATDDTNAWNCALAYLGNNPLVPQILLCLAPQNLIAGPQITVPPSVMIASMHSFERPDGNAATGIPCISFSGPTGGFLLSEASSIKGLSLYAAGSQNHLVEVTGKFLLESVKLNTYLHGLLVTRSVVTGGRSFVDQITTQSGLAPGTYAKVPLNNTTGVTATIVVGSGGTIASVTIDGAGTVATPYIQVGVAAGALYSGSPSIGVLGTLATCNTGGSRARDIFVEMGQQAGIGIEADAAYDIVHFSNLEVWSSASLAVGTPTSIGVRFGRVDAMKISNSLIYNINTAISGDGPGFYSGGDFTTISCVDIDGCNYGSSITVPLDNLSIIGGYGRVFTSDVFINNATTNFVISARDILSRAGNPISIANCANGNVSGNNLHEGSSSYAAVEISPPSALASYAKQQVFVGSNNLDGSQPGVYVGSYAGRVTIGPNNWPDSSSQAYVNNLGSHTVQMPTTGGPISVSVGSNGQGQYPHNLGCAPPLASVRMIGSQAVSGYRAELVSVSSSAMTIQVLDKTGTAVTSGTYSMIFQA